jgi:hypothetical protein
MTAATQKSLPNPGPTAVDPALADNLDELTAIANEIGAEGIWLVRGVKNAALTYTPTEDDKTAAAQRLEALEGIPELKLAKRSSFWLRNWLRTGHYLQMRLRMPYTLPLPRLMG